MIDSQLFGYLFNPGLEIRLLLRKDQWIGDVIEDPVMRV
jgi:hypothetical protein